MRKGTTKSFGGFPKVESSPRYLASPDEERVHSGRTTRIIHDLIAVGADAKRVRQFQMTLTARSPDQLEQGNALPRLLSPDQLIGFRSPSQQAKTRPGTTIHSPALTFERLMSPTFEQYKIDHLNKVKALQGIYHRLENPFGGDAQEEAAYQMRGKRDQDVPEFNAGDRLEFMIEPGQITYRQIRVEGHESPLLLSVDVKGIKAGAIVKVYASTSFRKPEKHNCDECYEGKIIRIYEGDHGRVFTSARLSLGFWCNTVVKVVLMTRFGESQQRRASNYNEDGFIPQKKIDKLGNLDKDTLGKMIDAVQKKRKSQIYDGHYDIVRQNIARAVACAQPEYKIHTAQQRVQKGNMRQDQASERRREMQMDLFEKKRFLAQKHEILLHVKEFMEERVLADKRTQVIQTCWLTALGVINYSGMLYAFLKIEIERRRRIQEALRVLTRGFKVIKKERLPKKKGRNPEQRLCTNILLTNEIACLLLKPAMKTKCEDIARSVIKQLLEPLRYMSKSKAFYRGVVLLQEGIRKYFKRKRRFFRLLDTVFDKYFQLIKTDKIHTVVKHAPKSPKSPKAIAMSRKKRNTAIIPQTLEVDEDIKRDWIAAYWNLRMREYRNEFDAFMARVNALKEEDRGGYLLGNAMQKGLTDEEEDQKFFQLELGNAPRSPRNKEGGVPEMPTLFEPPTIPQLRDMVMPMIEAKQAAHRPPP